MKDRFQMSWATLISKARPEGLWASAYHIKVAVRDGNTFWLSSGNWQSSNQPDVHPFEPSGKVPPGFQRKYNRDYHAIIVNDRLASIYDRQGAPEKAVKVYEQALQQNQKNAQLLIDLALLYANRLHNPAKAMALAKDAYKLAPDDPDISYALGRLALAGGDCKWALSLLQQAAQVVTSCLHVEALSASESARVLVTRRDLGNRIAPTPP